MVSVEDHGADESVDYWYQATYQVVLCQGCRNLSFRKDMVNSVDEDYDDGGNAFPAGHEELYPSRVAGRHRLREIYHLPRERLSDL